MMIELIPAIDIIDGKCVRLSQGKYESRKVYNEDPLEAAKMFEDHGLTRLHMVDLDGAAAHHVVNLRVLERVTTHTSLVIDFGGGIKSDSDLKAVFDSGAQMATGGSIAVKSPETFHEWLQTYGPDRIMLGADVRDEYIAVSGWKEESGLKLFPFLDEHVSRGVRKTVCTDIGRDGMLQGPALPLYRKIRERYPELYLIASGGVGNMDDIRALAQADVPAVIFGKALYEGRITMEEIEHYLATSPGQSTSNP